MALQIQKHTAQIDTIDGKVTAQASTMQALQAAWREDDGTGAMNEALKAYQSTASIVTNEKVIAEEKLASATRYTTLNAAVGKNAANLTSLEEVVATDKQATAQKIETLTATANDATAKAEIASTAVSGLNGKVSALTTIKTSTTVGGRTVMAGLAIGVEGDTQESQILAFAQRFAILDEVSGQMIAPFVVQGGQVFMNTAIISQAFIKELVLGMTLRSAALNNQGLPLLEINIPAGTFTLRGQSDSGYTLLNNNGIYVYDLNYIERAALGKMT
jgi:predicted phage tail protein